MSVTSPTPATVVDLRDYVDVIRARKWTIAVVAGVIVAVVTSWTLVQPVAYRAVATVQILPLVNPLISPPSTVSAAQPDMPTEATVAGSTAVADIVGRSPSAGARSVLELVKDVSAEPAAEGNILVISFAAGDPHTAATLANAFARAYLEYRRRTATAPVTTAIATQRMTLEKLSRELASATSDSDRALVSSRVVAAQESLRQYESALRLVTPGVVIGPASAETATRSPDLVRNAVLALAIGLVLGVGIAFLRAAMQGRGPVESAGPARSRADRDESERGSGDGNGDRDESAVRP